MKNCNIINKHVYTINKKIIVYKGDKANSAYGLLNIKVYICDEIISNKAVRAKKIAITIQVSSNFVLKNIKDNKVKTKILIIVLYGTGIINLLKATEINKSNI